MLRMPRIAEQHAVDLLRGVGSAAEWWLFNDAAAIGHLRVGMTTDEYAHIPPGMAEFDAGPSGPRRKRSR